MPQMIKQSWPSAQTIRGFGPKLLSLMGRGAEAAAPVEDQIFNPIQGARAGGAGVFSRLGDAAAKSGLTRGRLLAGGALAGAYGGEALLQNQNQGLEKQIRDLALAGHTVPDPAAARQSESLDPTMKALGIMAPVTLGGLLLYHVLSRRQEALKAHPELEEGDE